MNRSVSQRVLGMWLLQHWRHLVLALGSVLLLGLLAVSYRQASASLDALDNLQQLGERTSRLDSLLLQLSEAESAVRAYLLSHKRADLEPYVNSQATVEFLLEDIRREASPAPEDVQVLARLTDLVTLRMRILARAVDEGRPGEEATPAPAPSSGQRYMDGIRETIGELRSRMLARGQSSLDRSIAHVQAMRWVVGGLSGAALALLAMIFVAVQRELAIRAQLADLLRSENERLERQVRARTAELSDLASYLTDAREAERAKLARELHDELGALLTAAKMDAGWIVRKLAPEALAPLRERFDRLAQTLDEGISLKRQIIEDLRPPLLEELGLVSALRTLGEDFAAGSEAAVRLELPDSDIDLPPQHALALFRIAQEALTNIRRHAAASNVQLALARVGEQLQLSIADDGAGFDPAQSDRRRRGLAGMQHRVQMLAGRFVVDSRPGAGTRICVSLPLSAAESLGVA
jgi:protein-histidine pros-kinase